MGLSYLGLRIADCGLRIWKAWGMEHGAMTKVSVFRFQLLCFSFLTPET